jgi:hypothetical protein
LQAQRRLDEPMGNHFRQNVDDSDQLPVVRGAKKEWECFVKLPDFLLAAGMVGIVVPIIPGIPLLFAGGVLLAPKYPRIRIAMEYVRRKLGMAKAGWGYGRQIPSR